MTDEEERPFLLASEERGSSIDGAGEADAEIDEKAQLLNDFYKSSKIAIFLIVFLGAVGFAIVLPSLWPYLDTKGASRTYLGFVVAIFSAAQFTASPLLGYWSNRGSTRSVLVVSLCITVIGNVLYALAPDKEVILAARLIAGFGAGNVASCRAYISSVTPISQRTKVMAQLSAAQGMGFILGPAFGTVLSTFHISRGWFEFDQYTAAGWFSAVFAIACMLLLLRFKDVKPSQSNMYSLDPEKGEGEISEDMEELIPNPKEPASAPLEAVPKTPIFVCIFMFWIVLSVFSVFETIGTAFTGDVYGWGVAANGIMFGGAGVVGVIAFMSLGPLNKVARDRTILLGGFIILLGGFAVIINLSSDYVHLARFVCGVVLIAIGYPVAQSAVFGLYSKVLGSTPQGLYMGYITASGSFARMIGPLWASAIYDHYGAGLVFLTSCSFVTLAILVFGFYYHHLIARPTTVVDTAVN